jgi:hypothetical protein
MNHWKLACEIFYGNEIFLCVKIENLVTLCQFMPGEFNAVGVLVGSMNHRTVYG